MIDVVGPEQSRLQKYLPVQDVLIYASDECLPESNEAAEAEAQLLGHKLVE